MLAPTLIEAESLWLSGEHLDAERRLLAARRRALAAGDQGLAQQADVALARLFLHLDAERRASRHLARALQHPVDDGETWGWIFVARPARRAARRGPRRGRGGHLSRPARGLARAGGRGGGGAVLAGAPAA